MNNADTLLIGIIYRSESGSNSNNENLIELINEISENQYSHLLLLGDLIYPRINWDSWHVPGDDSRESRFVKWLQDNFLFQHVNKPTRCRGTDTPHILDLVITNAENSSDMEYQSPIRKSDHSVLGFHYNCYAIQQDKQFEKTLYDKGDYEGMQSELDDTDWGDLIGGYDDINDMWKVFTDRLHELECKYVPKRKYNKHGKKGNFEIDNDTKNLIKRKHALSRKVMASNTDENSRAYNKMRNKVSSTIKKINKKMQ